MGRMGGRRLGLEPQDRTGFPRDPDTHRHKPRKLHGRAATPPGGGILKFLFCFIHNNNNKSSPKAQWP